MDSILPLSGPAGTQVTVSGSYFPGPVELRWGSATGPIVGTGAGGQSFQAQARVPEGTKAGVYALMAVTTGPQGRLYQAAQPFEVTGPAGSVAQTGAADLWSGLNRSASVGPDSATQAAPRPSAITAGGILMAAGAVLAAGSGGMLLVARKRRARIS